MDNSTHKDQTGCGIQEIHTDNVCIHPYYGFICKPNSTIHFDTVIPKVFGSHETLIETDQFGFRNKDLPETKPENEFWIGWFGGSAAFSAASSSNDTTIPAFLEGRLNEWAKTQTSKSSLRFRVINYALPGGQQPATTHIFLDKARQLDGIVTFDGHNEIIVPAYYNRNTIPDHFPFISFYSTLYFNSISKHQFALSYLKNYISMKYHSLPGIFKAILKIPHQKFSKNIKKKLNSLSSNDPKLLSLHHIRGKSRETLIKDGALRWYQHIQHMNEICLAQNLEPLFLLQPIPEIGKQLTPEEQSYMEPEYAEIRKEGYVLLGKYLEKLQSKNICSEDLTGVFEKETGDIYTDIIHFQDKGCKIVANAIFDLILKRWKLVQFR